MVIIMTKEGLFEVESMQTVSFDENGKENGTWEGYSVVKSDDKANYCFDMRDKLNADRLCEFINNECIIDDDISIDAFVMDNLIEWSNLISELSKKEIKLYQLKEEYEVQSDLLLKEAQENRGDIIKSIYGGNNDKTRKKYVKEELTDEFQEIKDMEFSVDYLKRRISFIRQLINTKTILMEVKKE